MHLNGHIHTHPNTHDHGHVDANPDTYEDMDRNSHTYVYAHRNGDTHRHANTDPDANVRADSGAECDGYTDRRAHRNAGAAAHSATALYAADLAAAGDGRVRSPAARQTALDDCQQGCYDSRA